MRKLAQTTFVIVAVLAFSLSFVQCSNAKKKLIEAQVSVLNKACPMKIDQITTLDEVKSTSGDVIEYNYTLSVGEEELGEGFKENMDTVLKQTLNSDASVKKLLEEGIKMKHVYKDKTGKEIYSGQFSADDIK